jgi:hypothetical protein
MAARLATTRLLPAARPVIRRGFSSRGFSTQGARDAFMYYTEPDRLKSFSRAFGVGASLYKAGDQGYRYYRSTSGSEASSASSEASSTCSATSPIEPVQRDRLRSLPSLPSIEEQRTTPFERIFMGYPSTRPKPMQRHRPNPTIVPRASYRITKASSRQTQPFVTRPMMPGRSASLSL